MVAMLRRAQALLRARPDAGQQPDVERREERCLLPGTDDREPAGLPPVGGDLRDDFAGGDAERAREGARPANGGLDGLGELAGGEEVRAISPRSRYPSSIPVCSTVGTTSRTACQTVCEYWR